MIAEPNAPVIVGVGAVQQRFDDPSLAAEPLVLIRSALEAAADDAGSRALLDTASTLLMPQGMWSSANPAAVMAPWNRTLHSVVANIGVLQQTLVSRACAMVASGEATIVLIAGGEAKFRSLRAQITGQTLTDTQTSGAPDERLVPADEIITTEEINRGLPVPARQYAMIDTALRHSQGLTPTEHRTLLAALQSRFSKVAAANPDAWSRSIVEPDTLLDPPPSNPMLAWPYTKLHCSQWNVDQAAGLIVCSAAEAERLGIARDKWVFAHLGVESNLMVPLTLRADIHRSPAIAVFGSTLEEHCRVTAADVEHLDLYSCFPAAVRVQAAELGVDLSRELTVTGGMTFSGGPLNNFTLQALVAMTRILRSDPGSRGLVTNISGMLTKFGASLWSCRPPDGRYRSIDITAAAAHKTKVAPFDPDHVGPARVVTYTVACDRGAPIQGIVIGETDTGTRVLATTDDPETMAEMMASEWCDRQVTVAGAGFMP